MLVSTCGYNMYITATRECTNTSRAGSDVRWSLCIWTIIASYTRSIPMNNVILYL